MRMRPSLYPSFCGRKNSQKHTLDMEFPGYRMLKESCGMARTACAILDFFTSCRGGSVQLEPFYRLSIGFHIR